MSLVSRYLEPALVERLNALQLSARRVVEGQTLGQHRSPVRGASVEFRQHRAYVPGDEPRRLDWRVFARTDRPFVRQYEQETNLRCAILLDRSGSMGYEGRSDEAGSRAAGGDKRRSGGGGSKFDYAGKLTASLAYLMLGQNESVGLATFDRRVETWLAPHGGSAQLSRVVDVLERSTPGGASDAPAAMHDLADRLGRRSLVIIISDFFAPVETLNRALARLRHARHEIISLRVLHQDESEFPFRNWVRLRGLEGEAARLCEPALVRQQYLDRFNRHASALADAHKAHAAEFHSFVTAMPVGDALVNFLRHRALGGPAGAGSVAHV